MTHVGGIAWIMNKEPAMVISGVIAAVGLSLPYLVVPIRRSMGLPTYQWDSDTNTNPVRLFTLVHAPPLFTLVSFIYGLFP